MLPNLLVDVRIPLYTTRSIRAHDLNLGNMDQFGMHSQWIHLILSSIHNQQESWETCEKICHWKHTKCHWESLDYHSYILTYSLPSTHDIYMPLMLTQYLLQCRANHNDFNMHPTILAICLASCFQVSTKNIIPTPSTIISNII